MLTSLGVNDAQASRFPCTLLYPLSSLVYSRWNTFASFLVGEKLHGRWPRTWQQALWSLGGVPAKTTGPTAFRPLFAQP